ncbi:type IV pilin protein [Vibrio ostreae]|uniref:Prepilin-type N-terminal cleavage/methylation domain-containing protein n=1 Tax=Vibrio ostreae TaxID=2841925 RepID=A0A975UA40_9VIBR|nr:type IV pilin protein [Vibrio ostreae]QXO16724.1 prepilin-type N-terminal cleavage/methylation domain-containing protein [Vibrio ostreae]
MEMIRINNCNRGQSNIQGMTLIELILAMALLLILSALTYPLYADHMQRAHRGLALSDMTRIQLQLETSYRNGYHRQEIFNAGHCLLCESDPNRYQIGLELSEGGYLIYATPQTQTEQNSDRCDGQLYTRLTLSSQGEREPVACWR